MARPVILTGGIGSGKSTAAALLSEWGAQVVDADELAREVVAPGSEGLSEVVEEFGTDVLAADGSLDREALAEVVFDDPERLGALEQIVPPLVEALASERLAAGVGAPLLVYEVPLPRGRAPFPEGVLSAGAALVVVVDVPVEERHRRLAGRGLSGQQITARMASQPSREEWLAAADVVVDNSGDREHLSRQLADLWATYTGREAPVGRDG